MNDLSIYFHIPFCLKKCNYCSFYSTIFIKEVKDKFINSLLKELNLNLDLLQNYNIKTIYFGGGTPSILEEKDFEKIFLFFRNKLNLKNLKEITIEVNPETVNYEKFRNLKDFGLNRISLGVESFLDRSLKFLGRVHNKEKIFESFDILRKLNYKNINLDLILGIPKESLKEFLNNLKISVSLNPEHISIYSLEYYKDSKLYLDLINGKINSWSKTKERDAYKKAKAFLEKNGYIQYEISNFSKPYFESLHNLNYWSGGEYIGFGPKAYSFIKGVYILNGNLQFYINSLSKDKYPYVKILNLNKEKLKKILFILSLRKIDGVSISEFEKRFGKLNIIDKLNEYKKLGFINFMKNRVLLTNKGIIVGNEIFSDLI
jgi:oxygen-independent coproporphyrinogen-3 oxidase